MQLNSKKSGSGSPYIVLLLLLLVVGKAVSSGTLALSLWPLAGHTGKAHPLKPAHLPLHCQPTSSLDWKIIMNHQPTHSLRKKYIPVRRYKYSVGSLVTYYTRSITVNRNKDILSAITANRAFRGMAGLAVLCPSVVDCIGWRLETL